MYLKSSLKDYLNKLSSSEPVPGGGGTSALVAALGIALMIMVSKITLKRLDKEKQKNLAKTIKALEHLKRNAEQVIDLDPKTYQQVMASYSRLRNLGKTPKGQREVEVALANSFRLQADLTLLIVMAKELLSVVDSFSKGSIRNDLIVASGLLDGAFRGASSTARINVVYMKESKQKQHFERGLEKLEQKFGKINFE